MDSVDGAIEFSHTGPAMKIERGYAQHDGSRNDKGAVSYSREMLKKAKAQGKGVYVVEYVGGKTASSVKAQARKDGFVPTVGHRDLKSATDE